MAPQEIMEKVRFLDQQLIKMIYQKTNFFLFFFIFFNFFTSIYAENKIEHKIAVLVNEEVITSYDIIQRLKLKTIIQGIDINSQNQQVIINNIVDELIQEKVKLEKIREYKIKVSDDEYIEFENNFFKRYDINSSQIIQTLNENEIDYQELKDLLLNELSWSKLISGLFYRLTSVSELEVDEIIGKNAEISREQAEGFVIQRQLDLQSSKLLRDIMNEATIEYK